VLNELRVTLSCAAQRRPAYATADVPAVSQGRTGTFTEHRPSDKLSDILRGGGACRPPSRIRSFAEQPVLIGYMRISKADGSQTLDPQRDALLAAGVEPGHLYEDQASGKRDNRPGLEACKALRRTQPPDRRP